MNALLGCLAPLAMVVTSTWIIATTRERKRCSEIVRLRSVDHPVFDVRENGRNIRADIWAGWDPKLYILPMPHAVHDTVTLCAEDGCDELVGIQGARCVMCICRIRTAEPSSTSHPTKDE